MAPHASDMAAQYSHPPSRPDQKPPTTQRPAPRQRNATTSVPRNLVFVNFSNPQDNKKEENRKTISKWAMINRPRPDLVAPAPAPLPAPPPSLPRESTFSSQATTSPPATASSWSTVDDTSPPENGQWDLAYRPQPLEGYFDDEWTGDGLGADMNFDNYQASDFFTTDAGGQFTTDAGGQFAPAVGGQFPKVAGEHFTTAAGGQFAQVEPLPSACLQGPSQTKKSRAKSHQSSNSTSSQQLTRRMRKQPMATPSIHILGAVADPFDCLPIKADAHTHELVYMYLNAQNLSPALAKSGTQVLDRLKGSRDQIWWPLTRNSKAALAALIAYVESTPEMKNKARSPSFLQKHLDVAMAAITESLQSGTTATDDGICFAIVLLMITAQRLQDTQIFHVHSKMLEAVLAQRQATPTYPNRTKKISFPTPSNGLSSSRCLYCRDSYKERDPSCSRETSPETSLTPGMPPPSFQNGMGFYDLISSGHLSPSMRGFIDQGLEWNRIALLAKRDRLSAAAGASHAWVDGSSKTEAKTPFDQSVFFAARLCLYLSAWLDWNHSCAAVRSMLGAVHDGLQASDMEALLAGASEAVLWVSLLAGPYSEGEARVFFSGLLVRAQRATGLYVFEEALARVGERFLWSPTMTPAAERFFWDGLLLPSF